MSVGVNYQSVVIGRQGRAQWFARACLLTLFLGLLAAANVNANTYYDDSGTNDILDNVLDDGGCTGCHSGTATACTGGANSTTFVNYEGVYNCYTRIRNKLDSNSSLWITDRMPQGGPFTSNATYLSALTTWNNAGRPMDVPNTPTNSTPTGVTRTGATLRAFFNPNTLGGGQIRFSWGPTAALGSFTSATTLNSTMSAANTTAGSTGSHSISGLDCGRDYFYRGQVRNGGNASYTSASSNQSFFTSNCLAPVITEGATENVAMSEDGVPTPFSLTLNATDSDANSSLTWTISSQASNGTASIAGGGTGTSEPIAYTPNLNYTGPDSFQVTVTDTANVGANGSHTDTITVNVTVNAVNDSPVITEGAGPVAVTMDEDGSPTPFSLTLNATDTDSGTLTWSISSGASNGTATATGTGLSKAIGYTPTADFNGADSFVVQVTDGGSTPDTIQVNVTIDPRNDQPVISAIGAQAATEGVAFMLTPTVTDPDDPNNGSGALSWSIQSGAQPGMVISNTGVLTWTPPLGTPPPPATFNQMYPVTIRVQDDLTHGSTPDDESFTITVNPPDSDSDMVADYNDYCPTNADGSNADNDGDGTRGFDADPNDNVGGDVCDADDDNDGMPDLFEDANSFDAFDSADATQDADGDGVSNLQEYLDGTNPNQENLVIDATGYLTPYELVPPDPTSIHSLATTVTASDYGPYRPGDNTITWTPSNATDDDLATSDPGNLVSDPPEQPFSIRPLVSFGVDQQAEENAAVMVTVMLNGDSPSWPGSPATVDYSVSGTAGAGDHDAVDGTVTFADGEYIKTINFNTLADGKQDPDETVVFTLSNPVNVAIGSNKRSTVTIVEDNVAPQVELQFTQGAIVVGSTYAGSGAITVDALVSDVNGSQTHSYDWSGTDNVLLPPGDVANWAIPVPAPGNYLIDVVVTDQGNPKPSQSTRMTRILRVDSGMPPMLTAADSDMDGIPDNDAAEGYADDDGDGIPNYLDAIDGLVAGANLIPDQTIDASATRMLQTESGLRIGRGSTAQAANRFGALLTDKEIRRFGDTRGGQPANPGDNQEHVGGIYDFEIRGLVPGASARVVIPLQSAIPKNAEYRKFHPATGWTTFASDNNNRIASASADDGACPEAGSKAYRSGLNYLDNCLELTIQDGGPNDTDSRRNGVVSDPGTIGTRLTDPEEEEVEEGGGRMSPLLLISMLLLAGFAYWRRRRAGLVAQD